MQNVDKQLKKQIPVNQNGRLYVIDSLLGVFAKLQNATVDFVMSDCPCAQNNSAPTEEI
jgi:hypothetical protein